MRRHGPADLLSINHQKVVDGDPIPPWKDLPQGELGLFRSFRFHQTPSVRDTVDMGVHTNAGLSVTQCNHKVGCLAPDSFEGKKILESLGNLPFKPVEQVL
jgi:hypothetical protein